MNDSEFTCDKCKEKFKKGWSEEEAEQEFKTAPWNIPSEKRGVLCNDCFEAFKIWFDGLTNDDHERIRADKLNYE
jgi:hypothetical protein